MVAVSLCRVIFPRFYSLSCRTVQRSSAGRRSISTGSPNFAAASQIGRVYTDKHEWVEVSAEDSTVATVGISHYAQEALGDVVFAQLPSVGAEIKQHDEVGALESVKAASELYSPVSGKVVQVNTEVENSPGLINKACYTQGWLFKILLSNSDELKSLMDEDAYKKFVSSSDH
ncbi:Glycine cleavage system H protein [Nesidiocoris tenuis]|uniref:Glycine cleavage system H protein n=1 Tax=Nesidiocoris tenuis TaxID=355587 RepID=A0ABN7B2T3_9HEMI|nr:Glycine cleavage system H protein [Nesidiocoris tenuis]